MTAPLLVVHDEGDDVVPFADGAALAAAWPGARLVRTTGLGHRAVLRAAGVIDEVVQFVTDRAPALRQHTGRHGTAMAAINR
jgi:pimeloyl-ACP methyl ester carboxylesterase